MALNINFSQQHYGGKKFRPATIVDFDRETKLLICVTPWGQTSVAEKVIESIKSFIVTASEDTEMTVPYARKETLQQMGNILRMAIIMASEKIFNEFNKDEYTCGFEIFAAIQEGPQWIFVGCGQPGVVLCRNDLGVLPLYQAIDLNILTLSKTIEDPLPNHILGLGQHPPISFGNFRLQGNDKIFLISRSILPSKLFQIDATQLTSEKVAYTLATDHADMPFWLGLIDID